MARKDPKPPAKIPGDQRSQEQEQFFEEVSEELKQERYALLWKKYGRYFVGLAVVMVLAVAGYQYCFMCLICNHCLLTIRLIVTPLHHTRIQLHGLEEGLCCCLVVRMNQNHSPVNDLARCIWFQPANA